MRGQKLIILSGSPCVGKSTAGEVALMCKETIDGYRDRNCKPHLSKEIYLNDIEIAGASGLQDLPG